MTDKVEPFVPHKQYYTAESWLQPSLIIIFSLSTIEEIEGFNGGRIIRTDNGHLYIRNVSSYIIGTAGLMGQLPFGLGTVSLGSYGTFKITDTKLTFYVLAKEH